MAGLRIRELPARLAIVSFLWAILLGPALHLVNHRDDHRHGPGGAAHRHAPASEVGSGHATATTLAAAADATTPTGSSPPLGPHGGGELLHFGLALLDSAAPPLLLIPEPAPELAMARLPGIGPARRDLGALSARGPPPATLLVSSAPGLV
jgi:hypothetical protein